MTGDRSEYLGNFFGYLDVRISCLVLPGSFGKLYVMCTVFR